MTFDEWFDFANEQNVNGVYNERGLCELAFEAGQRNCDCVNTDNTKVIAELQKENESLKHENEQLAKMADHYKETLKKVRVALIQERVANLCNGVDAMKIFDNLIKTVGEEQ